MFPTASDYKNRIVDATFGPSKSTRNPMITLSLELEAPEEIESIDDSGNVKSYTVAGVVKTKFRLVTAVIPPDDASEADITEAAQKTEGCRKRCSQFFTSIGINPDTVNWDNPDLNPIKGKLIYTEMDANVVEKRKNPTQAQIAKAKAKGEEPLGDIMKNPITGKPLVDYWPNVVQIFGSVPGSSTIDTGGM